MNLDKGALGAVSQLMDHTADLERGPNPVDLHVGARIRMRRKLLGVSQERLADELGLTFQQVQKYERGANRISASKLFEIARFLEAPVAYFFEGLSGPAVESEGFSGTRSEQFVHEFLMSTEGLELAALLPQLRSKQRRRILELVRTLADVDEEEE
jgi:transcriptional regulator with XRE-family HTH domain